MSWPERLFRLDGALPREFTPRRLRTWRQLILLALVAAFPTAYVAYHVERVQPFADHLSTVILEPLINDDDDSASSPDAKP